MSDGVPRFGADRLLALADRLAGQRVLVLADLVLDRFLTGTPKRISREAPVLILRYAGETGVPGGGANAVANIRALGGEPLAVGLVGDDESGRLLRAELEARGISTRRILEVAGYRTPTKTRILAGFPHGSKQQIVRYDVEDEIAAGAGAAVAARLREAIAAAAGEARVAVVSDYGYGAAHPALLPALREALGPGGVVVVDSRYRLGDYRDIDGATPNEQEAEELAGGELPAALPDLGRAVGRLRERLAARFLLVTRGSRGMVLASGEGALAIPVHGTDQVADVTGAGDTVIGTFALALAAGAAPEEAALLANYAGGIVVMKMGTATTSPEELCEAIRRDPRPLEEATWARW
ncbi:MAG TPA: PfkB family carbohydrate kinase [Thermoanaerobaculia bacterium]|nr:PfkB family carbohydrate kinase [Thermoanaerobaculia bacterium]